MPNRQARETSKKSLKKCCTAIRLKREREREREQYLRISTNEIYIL